MTTEREALDRIATAAREAERQGTFLGNDDLLAIIAAVTPEPGLTLTPEEAALVVQVLREHGLRHYGATHHTRLPYGVLADRLEQNGSTR